MFNNNDTTKLVGFSIAPSLSVVVPANTMSARPVTATLADQIMGANALKNLVGWNVQVLDILFHNECTTISSHAVTSVLNSISPGSAMLESVFAYPAVMLSLMSVSFAPFQNCTFPKDANATPKTVNYLWSVGFGSDPNINLSNEIVIS